VAVDGDPRGERMVWLQEPLSQSETIVRYTLGQTRQNFRDGGLPRVPALIVFTAVEDEGRGLGVTLIHHMGDRSAGLDSCLFFLQRLELLVEFAADAIDG